MGNQCCTEDIQIQNVEVHLNLTKKMQSTSHFISHQPNQVKQVSPLQEQPKQKLPYQGQIILPDGSQYNGQLQNELPHGYGIESHQNGQKYQGNFKEGLKNGQGQYKFLNNSKYKGEFVKGCMSGKGRMEWENGDWYEGQFKNNIINGLGVYYKKDKDAYFEGSYKNGLKNGKGKVKIGSYQFQGEWVMGNLKKK